MNKILRMVVLFIGAGACAVLGDNMNVICDKLGLAKENDHCDDPAESVEATEEMEESNNKEEE